MKINTLPLTHQATIPASYLDVMGHMNVMWYTHLFDEATWHFFALLGMDIPYFEQNQAGAFALESHTRYLAEVRLGNAITIHTRALGRTPKRLHFMHFMVLDATGSLAATAELLGMHIDRTIRRSSPFPTHITAAIDELLAQHSQLDWDAPTCGVMRP